MNCVISGCTKDTGRRLHLCQMHYERLRLKGTTYAYRERVCSKCDRTVVANGLCGNHYMKLKRAGTFQRLRREKKPGGRTHREKHLLNRYGLSIEQYVEMEKNQGRRCAICQLEQRSQTMFVDHDHTTGETRGLLCRSCNTMLGFLEFHEDTDRVLAGVSAYCEAYLI